jgi:outer membrane usher protein
MRRWKVAVLSISSLALPIRAMADVGVPEVVQTAPPGLGGRLNTMGRDIPLGGPLTDGGQVLGEIAYVLTADDRIVVEAPALLAMLQTVMSPAAWQQLSTLIGDRSEISAQELTDIGLPVTYDPATFGLTLQLNPDMRPRQVVSVAGSPTTLAADQISPEPLSGYVTAFVSGDYVHEGDDQGFVSPSVLLDSAIRFRGFVLENEGVYQDEFRREGTRVVFDDQKRTARYTAGDLEPASRGFSGASPMSGASIMRVYADLEPQRNIQPTGQRSFTLVRPSTVETFINGRSVQQMRLNPGTYDIRDFPFAQGANDVRLVIRDDFGGENVVSFSINFDRTLLATGLTEFGFFAGVESPFSGDGRDYTSTPAASGFYRRGVSDELTAGANFQVNDRGGVVGGEAVWAAPIGKIGVDLAASNVNDIGSGYALNMGYERAFSNNLGAASFVGTFQTTSRDFAVPTALTAINPFSYELGATLSQTIGRDHYVTADAFYSVGRDGTDDQHSLRTTYGWRASPRTLFTAEAVYQDRRGESEFGVRLALTYRFSQFSSGSAEVDTRRERARVGYQTARGRGVGSWNASVNVDRYDDGAGVNASYTTILNRAELGAAHLTSFASDGGDIVDQRTSLRAGASLAFAGGSVAVSRPIYDSFAIVKPHRTLKDAQVYVEPRDDEFTSRSGMLGGAVVPELSAYSPRIITYDVPDAPVGYDLGQGAIQVLPAYRSGYLVEIGSDYSVTYTGRLLKDDGSPVQLIAGLAYEEAHPERAPIRMFSNGTGRFAIQGLRAGRWRLQIPSGSQRESIYIIEVPMNAEGLVRGGEMKPESRQ